MIDYFEVLGVDRHASREEIKKAYRDLSKKYHPDRGSGTRGKFQEIVQAYKVLSDPEKRRTHEQELENGTTEKPFEAAAKCWDALMQKYQVKRRAQ